MERPARRITLTQDEPRTEVFRATFDDVSTWSPARHTNVHRDQQDRFTVVITEPNLAVPDRELFLVATHEIELAGRTLAAEDARIAKQRPGGKSQGAVTSRKARSRRDQIVTLYRKTDQTEPDTVRRETVANRLGVTERTVRNHLNAAAGKQRP